MCLSWTKAHGIMFFRFDVCLCLIVVGTSEKGQTHYFHLALPHFSIYALCVRRITICNHASIPFTNTHTHTPTSHAHVERRCLMLKSSSLSFTKLFGLTPENWIKCCVNGMWWLICERASMRWKGRPICFILFNLVGSSVLRIVWNIILFFPLGELWPKCARSVCAMKPYNNKLISLRKMLRHVKSLWPLLVCGNEIYAKAWAYTCTA